MMNERSSSSPQSEPQWAFPYEPYAAAINLMQPSPAYYGAGPTQYYNNSSFMVGSPPAPSPKPVQESPNGINSSGGSGSGIINTINDRGISIADLHNVPVDQLPQPSLEGGEWREYMRREIEDARRPRFEKRRAIASTPRALFEVKPKCYCPRVVTMGPMCRKLGPVAMDRCKALCIKEFMDRRKISGLDALLGLIVPDPLLLGNVYFGLPKYDFDALQLMVAIDAVFLHDLLLFVARDNCPDDYLFAFFNNEVTFSQALRDLFLMGNQIPMSFLSTVAALPGAELPLRELVFCLQYMVWRRNPFMASHPESESHHADIVELSQGVSVLECEHLLDCLYVSCCSRRRRNKKPGNGAKGEQEEEQEEEESEESEPIYRPKNRLPRASELRKVGIKFRARKGNISVVRYNKRKLRLDLPRLAVFDETEDMLRNLVAYELTSKSGAEFCGYAILMDSLIDTADDLAILYKSGVLENHLGSEERLVTMWNEMCVNIAESSSARWEDITKTILVHYRSHWRVIYVEFCAKFFSKPWLWLSTIAAVLLLFMSALQTIYSVLSFYQS